MLPFREDLQFLRAGDRDSWHALLYFTVFWPQLPRGAAARGATAPVSCKLLKAFDQQICSPILTGRQWGSSHPLLRAGFILPHWVPAAVGDAMGCL